MSTLINSNLDSVSLRKFHGSLILDYDIINLHTMMQSLLLVRLIYKRFSAKVIFGGQISDWDWAPDDKLDC